MLAKVTLKKGSKEINLQSQESDFFNWIVHIKNVVKTDGSPELIKIKASTLR